MILITGAAGFLGSLLAHRLNLLGREDLILVDRFRSGPKWKNLRGVKYQEFLQVEDFQEMESWRPFAQAEMIFHFGACSATTETDVDFLYKNNFLFSQSLWEFARERGIRFCYASSAATYGNGELGYNDDHESISKQRPINPYGYSKQLFDEWVLNRGNGPDIWCGLKFFNVYGPNEYHKEGMRSVVHKAYEQIKRGESLKLFRSDKEGIEDGQQKRDFVYALDVVDAAIQLLQNMTPEQSGIFNIGSGQANSFYDLGKYVFSALGLEPKIEFIEMPESLKGQYQYFTEANMEKFFSVLPEFKFMSFESAITHYVQKYLENINPYGDVEVKGRFRDEV